MLAGARARAAGPVREAARLHPAPRPTRLAAARRDAEPAPARLHEGLRPGGRRGRAGSAPTPPTGLGALRAIEVTVLHPTERVAARLRPPPAAAEPTSTRPVAPRSQDATDALVRTAIGPAAAATLGRLYGGHPARQRRPRAVRDPGGRRRPGRDRRVDVWPDGVVAAARSRSRAGSRTARGSRSAGTSCPSTRRTARTSAFHHAAASVELAFPSPYRLHAPTDAARRRPAARDARAGVTSTRSMEAFETSCSRSTTGPRRRAAADRHRRRPADIVTCQRRSPPAAQRGSDGGEPAIGGEAAPASDASRGRRSSTSSRTPTGTASGTSRSRCSGCGSSSSSTSCSTRWRPTTGCASRSTARSATVDDYLEVRPEGRAADPAADRRGPPRDRAVADPDGRVPRVGRDDRPQPRARLAPRPRRSGRRCAVGYLPDMFGHIAQMPQILRRAGHRATPSSGAASRAAIDRHAFTWRSPGRLGRRRPSTWSAATATARTSSTSPTGSPASSPRYVARPASVLRRRSILAMYGTDHAVPLPRLADLVDGVNAARRRHRRPARDAAPTYIERDDRRRPGPDAVRRPGPASCAPGARANMLMDVISARVDMQGRVRPRRAAPGALRRAAGRAPRRRPGRSGSSSSPGGGVVDNSAHDSICGCSHDAVVAQVLVRFAEAEQIGRGRAGRGAAGRSRRRRAGRPGASSTRRRTSATDLVELDLPSRATGSAVELALADGRRVPTQLVERPETGRSPSSRCRPPRSRSSSPGGSTAASCSAAQLDGHASLERRRGAAPRRGSTIARRRVRRPAASLDVDGAARRGRRRRPRPIPTSLAVSVVQRRPATAPRARCPAPAARLAPWSHAVEAAAATAASSRRRVRSSARAGSLPTASSAVAVADDGTLTVSGGGVDAARASAASSTAATSATPTTTDRRRPDTARRARRSVVVTGRSSPRAASRRDRGRPPLRLAGRARRRRGRARERRPRPDRGRDERRAARRRAVRPRRGRVRRTGRDDHRVRWHMPARPTRRPLLRRGPVRGRRARPDRRGRPRRGAAADASRPAASSQSPARRSCSEHITEYELVDGPRAGPDACSARPA